MSLRKLLFPVLMGFAVIASAPAAKAEFQITLRSAAFVGVLPNDELVITDETAGLDTAIPNPSRIVLNTEALNQILDAFGAGFNFSGLSLTSNKTTGVPANLATLTLEGGVVNTGTGPVALSILATDTGYTFPNGDRSLSSSSSMTFTDAFGSTSDFTSFYSLGTTSNDMDSPSSTAVYTAVVQVPGSPLFSEGKSSLPVGVGNSAAPFTLTSVLNVNLIQSNDILGFSGSTTVSASAIPEPATLSMILIGGAAVSFRSLRRRVKGDA